MIKIINKFKREVGIIPYLSKGYSRYCSCEWYSQAKKDCKNGNGDYSEEQLKKFHSDGYLSTSVKKYNIENTKKSKYISDLDYISLRPFNNSFSKWVEDVITTGFILKDFPDVCVKAYFSVVIRGRRHLLISLDEPERQCTSADVVELLNKVGELEFRPAYWSSNKKRYSFVNKNNKMYINGAVSNAEALRRIIYSSTSHYVISEPVSLRYAYNSGEEFNHYIKLWLSNDVGDSPQLLSAMFYYCREQLDSGRSRDYIPTPIDIRTGIFYVEDKECRIDSWSKITEHVLNISSSIKQISYYTMSIALSDESLFKILRFNINPVLPELPYNDELCDYLKKKLYREKVSVFKLVKQFFIALNNKISAKFMKIFSRKGIRPYMQKMWMSSVKDDFLHTKGASLKQKVWAYKHGFLSFRIWQYCLTKENYSNYVSDYDYYWLNRINNVYQKWVNDKTTYRLTMEPFKEYLPEYYFSVFTRNNAVCMARMPDCPDDISEDFTGLIKLLKEKGKLAFKASAGTHGDGFYCLEYTDNEFVINGKVCSETDIIKTVTGQKSFYIITEYLYMHEELRKIYPNSVNTIRVMVINQHGYDPEIMQTYMRIGSSKTGFTDNVGYGGVCAMVDKATGYYHDAEVLRSHYYYPCPTHPDTGVKITGFVPQWDELREAVLKIAAHFSALEYLGFDVAVTDKGIKVLEINIHQDLHKVAEFTPEINEFFKRKIAYKKRINGIRNDKENEK